MDIDLVVLPITVRDRQGQHVADLQGGILEFMNTAPFCAALRPSQRIRLFQHEDIPVIAGLLVDHSGSRRPKIAEVDRRRPGFCAIQTNGCAT